MPLSEASLRTLRSSSDPAGAVQTLLGDDPSSVVPDVLLEQHTENAGEVLDGAEYQVLGVDREDELLRVRATVFFTEEVWANGCSDTRMPEERQGDIEFDICLETGEVAYDSLHK
jgi:hypothetical protein